MTRDPGGTGESSANGHGRGKMAYRTTEFRKCEAGKQRLEAFIWIQQRRTSFAAEEKWGLRGVTIYSYNV